MEHSTERIVKTCESERIQAMHKRICQIKASEKTEVKYMQAWEERLMVKQEGIKEGENTKGKDSVVKRTERYAGRNPFQKGAGYDVQLIIWI